MFLKRLEIQGFKSFPEKLRLEFKSGITGIVGPNGSGKSNISDAIRWVLGEQNARNLRGDKMQDIIFAGTKNRKPLGFAEVSIVLDNTDKKLNLEYSEIIVTRKIYRSGESGYFINGTACRLKNIHELFMDTGIGKEGYSIIGQGKIDAILSTKTDDRRAIFEEASGIIKFKNRRTQAENRLEDVRKNLVRTNDIIDELEKQLVPLELQKNKANEFIKISENLKIVKINIFTFEYSKSEIDIAEVSKDICAMIESLKNIEIEKSKIIKTRDILIVKSEHLEENIQNSNNKLSNMNIELEQFSNYISLNNQTMEYAKTEIIKISGEYENNILIIEKKLKEIGLISGSLEGKNLEYRVKNKELSTLEHSFSTFIDNLQKEEDDIKHINLQIVNKLKESTELSGKIVLFKSNEEQHLYKLEEIQEQLNLNRSKFNEYVTKSEVLEKLLVGIVNNEKTFDMELDSLTKEQSELKSNISFLYKRLSNVNKNYIELKNKQKILQELENDYEGYFNSVKAILKEKNGKLKGIYGAVGELIEVPKKYEVAMEVALGSMLQHIIVNTENDAKNAIEYLKHTRKGRATFLPISVIKGKNINAKDTQILNEFGVIGIANSLITYDSKFNDVIASLLGRIIVVDNIDNAINIAKKYNHAYRIVTIDGDILNVGGSLTGGSINKKSTGIFSRVREIKDISTCITDIEHEISIVKTSIEEKELNKNKLIKKIEDIRLEISKTTIEKAQIDKDILVNNENLKHTKISINEFEKKLKSLEEQLEYNLDKFNECQIELENLNKSIDELKIGVDFHEDNIVQSRQNKDDMLTSINKLKMDINDISNSISNSMRESDRLNEEILNTKIYNDKLLQNIKAEEVKEKTAIDSIEKANDNIKNLKTNLANLIDLIKSLEFDKSEMYKKIRESDAQILESVTKYSEVGNELTKLENKKENIQSKIDMLTNVMWEEYEVTYASACNEFKKLDLHYNELKSCELDMKKEISNLGNVNVSAIEEFKITKDRYDFNIQQRDDIIKADDDLKDIIEKLTLDMEKQFKEQFSLINKNFEEVFSEMFGGGTAQLKLVDEVNVLNSGIEIVAQPSGKNLQNLTLLSGGERTLTAMSLLFAILMLKPSPFCILDEMEAALDDANVNRYSKFLKKFCGENQFILITHKTGTMEVVDVLYGVTMEEQGISKVISVELKEAKAYLP